MANNGYICSRKEDTAMNTKKKLKTLTTLFIVSFICSFFSVTYTQENLPTEGGISLNMKLNPHIPIGCLATPTDTIVDLASNHEYVAGYKVYFGKKDFHSEIEFVEKRFDKNTILKGIDPNASNAYKSGYTAGARLRIILICLFGMIYCLVPAWCILKMVSGVLKGNIYCRKNEQYLLYIGLFSFTVFIIGLIFKTVFWANAIPLIGKEGYRIVLTSSIGLEFLSIALFFFIMSEIFRLGRQMKEDQEFMV